MNPRILAAIATVISVVTKAHLSVTALGVTLSLSIPWLLLAAIALTAALLLLIVARHVRSFRSYPHVRTLQPAGAS